MRRMGLVVALLASVLSLAACDKETSDANQPGAVPMSKPPLTPDAGTYTGDPRGNPRPPRSGLNADPANPSGAPGTYTGPNIVR